METRLADRVPTFVVVLAIAAAAAAVASDDVGNLTGRVTDNNGAPLVGVSVVIRETGARRKTDLQGHYRFDSVPAGTYSLSLERGNRIEVVEGVTIAAGESRDLTHTLDWPAGFAESIVVTAVSRRPETILDAPGAVSVVTEPEIDLRAVNGQIPILLESKPGVELLQTTLYDFNINTRGFGRTLNRRVAVLVDGRNPAIPLLGSQEWGALSAPFEDLESVEFARGPNAALYGPNASNGVIVVTSRDPRDSQGGILRLSAGERNTTHADFRYAVGLGSDWYIKFLASYRESEGFTVSRMGAAEYGVPCGGGVSVDCLPQESIPLQADGVDIRSASLRLDKYVRALLFTLEGGKSDVDGVVFQSNIGRLQFVEVERPWLRFRVSHPRWNVQVSHNRREAPNQVALGSGLNLASDSDNTAVEAQGNWQWDNGIRLVAGGYYRDESVDSFDASRGVQSVLFEPVDERALAVYAQLDWALNDAFRLILGGRWDDSDVFYDDEFSPRAALVYSAGRHTLRLGYNRGFQAPNYVQSRLALDAAAPIDLSAAEDFCTPYGVSCGFADGSTRVLAVGNPDLGVEETEAFEIGYNGALSRRALLTVEYFNAENRDFFTDLLPTRGSPFGNFNTAFGPYVPPAGLPAQAASDLLAALQTALGTSFDTLSNAPDGTPILAVASYTTAGTVDTQGVDVALRYALSDRWGLYANYSWFDFEIKDDRPELESVLALNTPENSVRGGVTFEGKAVAFAMNGRWVDEFRWVTGPFIGDVESYASFDLSARYRVGRGVTLGIDVTNLLDNEHWENWGGDLMGRRALASVSFAW